jgi:hypothetical protein
MWYPAMVGVTARPRVRLRKSWALSPVKFNDLVLVSNKGPGENTSGKVIFQCEVCLWDHGADIAFDYPTRVGNHQSW